MSQDIFKQINNAILDLQSAQLQTYERPLKRLASLLHHEELEKQNNILTKDVDLESFLEASEKTGGSMIGSASLLWPESQVECLGLTLLLIDKLASNPNRALDFCYHYFYSGNKIIAGLQSFTRQIIIPFARDYKEFIKANGEIEVKIVKHISNKIFIVHGHDDGARESVARFLERQGFDAIILHEQANQGRTVIEKVEANSDVGFAVVLLTPDDEGCIKGGTAEPRARQNVLLELGYFIGRLGRNKVCALKKGDLEIPSDFAGVVWEKMDNAGAWKQALGRELEAAGYQIDWNKVMRS